MKFIVIIVPVILQHFVQPQSSLTPLSFVPPGSWNGCWCELSGGRGGMGGWRGGGAGGGGGGCQEALLFLQGALMLI